MSIYYDPVRNVYVDTESGALIPVDVNDAVPVLAVPVLTDDECKCGVNSYSKDIVDSDHALALSLHEMENDFHGSRVATPSSPLHQTFFQRLFSQVNMGDFMYRRAQTTTATSPVHYVPSNEAAPSGVNRDDWFLARALQAMEFEMQEDLNLTRSATENDFNNKELRASTCKSQLLTLSTAVVLVQIGVLIAVIQIYGYANRSENPMIGPDAQALVNFGAKEAGLIVKRGEWWRCVTSIFLHAGIFHILSNGLIQLRVGGYLNQVYGDVSWFLIYFVSGFFGNMMSCIFSEDSISVGSSGAVLGMLSSWIVWILFRWNKIPERAHGNRNCQLIVVLACVGITLGTSFSKYIDWAAHYGGAAMGVLWGIILISRELENPTTKLMVRIGGGCSIAGFLAWALYAMLTSDPPIVLEPN